MSAIAASSPAMTLRVTASSAAKAGKTMSVRMAAPAVRAASVGLGASSFVGTVLSAAAPAARSFNTHWASSISADAEWGASTWEEAPAPEPEVGPKLYVGNLSWHVDGDMLYEAFAAYGTVETADVVYDRETGRSRGFAFVVMGSAEEAGAAIEGLNGVEMEGRSCTVNYPMPRGAAGDRRAPRAGAGGRGAGRGAGRGDDTNKLFVGNLSWGMDDMGLEDVFAEFGTVTSARVITDRETGRSRGFGFVTMSSEDETAQAVSGLDGQEVDGRNLRVNPADAKPAGGGGGGRGGGGYGGGGGGGGGWDNYGDNSGGGDFYGGGESQW